MTTQKIGGANKVLQKLVNDRDFNFNKFMKMYTNKFPDVLNTAYGRESVMHVLNMAASKSIGANGTFYAIEMAEMIADALPRITENEVSGCMGQPHFIKEPLISESLLEKEEQYGEYQL